MSQRGLIGLTSHAALGDTGRSTGFYVPEGAHPWALVGLWLSDGRYLVDGKQVAAFTNAEEEAVGLTSVAPFLLADRLEAHGAEHRPVENFQAQVIVDGHLVTGQNPASAKGVADAVVTLLAQRAAVA